MAIKSIQQENGFTLVEIMIALVILSVGLMGAAYMQTNSVKDGTTSNRLTRRVTGAENLIEDFYIKDIKPDSVNLPELEDFYSYDSEDYPENKWNETFWDNETSPYYRIQAQSLGGEPLTNLTTIQVTLTPKGEKNEAAAARRTIVFNFVRSTKYNK
jgi:prepilin-type N-terminal cleavage/methylation domain-containing protein